MYYCSDVFTIYFTDLTTNPQFSAPNHSYLLRPLTSHSHPHPSLNYRAHVLEKRLNGPKYPSALLSEHLEFRLSVWCASRKKFFYLGPTPSLSRLSPSDQNNDSLRVYFVAQIRFRPSLTGLVVPGRSAEPRLRSHGVCKSI